MIDSPIERYLAVLVANGKVLYEYLADLYTKPVYYQSDKANAIRRINEFKSSYESIMIFIRSSDPIPSFPAVLLYLSTIRAILRDTLVPMCNILAKRVVQ